jgi:1-aminocyclopropane-1-carboxylate deaminase/D-cysteine desulfhydrase-like pyridoxal-dependent ACC family enzyme
MLAPIEEVNGVWLKRVDHYTIAGCNGGKAQVIAAMVAGACGVITAGPRTSSQIYIGARIAELYGIPFRCHLPRGPITAEMKDVEAHGGEIIQHVAGYNNVLEARAAEDLRGRRRWVGVPLWLRGPGTVRVVRKEVANVPKAAQRIVVVAGSGMTVAGVLAGLRDMRLNIPVLAVCVGADPTKTLDTFGGFGWRERCELVRPDSKYEKPAYGVRWGNVDLDPRYEAKAAPYLRKGDLFWVAGYGIHHKEG